MRSTSQAANLRIALTLTVGPSVESKTSRVLILLEWAANARKACATPSSAVSSSSWSAKACTVSSYKIACRFGKRGRARAAAAKDDDVAS